MGDDYWNPITAEMHVKREPLWKVCLAMAASVAAFLVSLWAVAVIILSLERMVS